MNEAEVRAIPVSNGYEAQFRKLHRTEWFPVRENGVAVLYETAELAEIAGYRALMRHLFGDGIVRHGERAGTARSEAEARFGRIFPGRNRSVVVERRRS